MGRWSNESFTMLLKMLKEELLPDETDLPNTYYGANKVIWNLGLSYERIDACRNDCMLYIGKRINYLILVKFVANPDGKSINVMGKQRTNRVKR
ncbi:hypothetical protein RDI58_004510 [Solanum bulbocastanum]|uniref:Uncharacterized protein n=1 Tax=Solanum bulbocastanum TaxID=147425 RepID=A0AAN8YK65_SOLBU